MGQEQWSKREAEILAFWKRERVFEQSVARDPANGEFVFFEGPPTANAPPGIHHVEARTFKDVIPRYKTMRGYRVRRKAGWDTHGLPVELQTEKKLGLKTKRDVEAYGIAAFNAQCRDSVWEFKKEWERLTDRIGFWLDQRNPYVTYEMSYVESVWWFLAQAWEKGLLVRDYKVVPWCPRCETPLSSHEVAQGYDEVDDPSVYVKFRIIDDGRLASALRHPEEAAPTRDPLQSGNGDISFLVWTTTPWTLPGNGALAVHPDGDYAVVRLPEKNTEGAPESPSVGSETRSTEGDLSLNTQDSSSKNAVKFQQSPAAGPEGNLRHRRMRLWRRTDESYLILAQPLIERVLGAGAEVVRTFKGRDLVGLRYEPLYPRIDIAAHPEAYRVLDAEFVSFDDGTGIVHIAPAYGEDDFAFSARGIPPTFSVDEKGIMADGLPGAGKFCKKADVDVCADLKARALLFRDETIRHTYPFCWRCHTPLLYYARASWYIAMSKLRAEIQAKNATIHWLPDHIRDGRFGEWLRELKDWAITRERYWGAPMPIWECDRCVEREVLGSFAELVAKATQRNRFLLMRHGEAESNARGVISARLGTSEQYPLTPEGRTRVTAAAERLKSAGITRIIASPYHRIRETAAIVSQAIGAPVTYDDRLREIDLPDFDGKPDAEFNSRFASPFEKFGTKVGANETWNELAARMLLALRDIDRQHEGETILICSHGDPLFLLEWAFSGRTREGIIAMPYPEFDAPHTFAFTGALVNDRGEFDVHRPFIDGITWPCAKAGCGGTMRRFPEVVDVWLESGCMPFAQVHFPFEQENGISNFKFQISNPPLLYPADYISEAIDQTRGWFYTLLAVATVLGWDAPYRNVIVLGHLLDKHGKKMSKSRGNIVNPNDMIERYGADVVRWYMLTVNQPWDPKLFDEADLKAMSNKPFGMLRNVLAFWELHGGNAAPQWVSLRGREGARSQLLDFEPFETGSVMPRNEAVEHRVAGDNEVTRSVIPSRVGGEGPPAENGAGSLLDSWLRARVAAVHAEATRHLDAYAITDAARAVGDLVDDVSTWWLRRSRERLKAGDAGARGTFTAALQSLSLLLAPFAPFTAEHIWRVLAVARHHPPSHFAEASRDESPPSDGHRSGEHKKNFSPSRGEGEGEGVGNRRPDSVHLAPWELEQPSLNERDATLLSEMVRIRRLCSLGLEARAAAGIPVRQALAALRVRAASGTFTDADLDLIRDEVNVKAVVVDPTLVDDVRLDTALTPELKREGMIRELIRAVNNIRKEMGLTPADHIAVTYHTDDAELKQAIAEHCEDLMRATAASDWVVGTPTDSISLSIGGAAIALSVAR